MVSPREFYKKNRNNDKLRLESYELFIRKYHQQRPDPDGFKLNERALLDGGAKNFFIPGKIYTFKYDPLYKSVLDYYDTRPIILCHDTYRAKGTKNDLVVGVNFNFLPEKFKVGTLQIFYDTFKKDIEKGVESASRNNIYVSTKLVGFLKNWLSSIQVFTRSNINYDFAYRQYIRSRITRQSLVEYDDWNLIPFVEAKNIMGKPLAYIYNEYLKTYDKKK